MKKTVWVSVLALSVSAPLAIHGIGAYQQRQAEKRFAAIEAAQDNAPTTQREYREGSTPMYEKCVRGWCIQSANRTDIDEYNGPTKGGSTFPTFDAAQAASILAQLKQQTRALERRASIEAAHDNVPATKED